MKLLRRNIIAVAVILVVAMPTLPAALQGGLSTNVWQIQGLVINGNLVVNNTTILANDTITVYGDVVVEAGGNLTLVNATLVVEKSGGNLTVRAGGYLKLVGGSSVEAAVDNGVVVFIYGSASLSNSFVRNTYLSMYSAQVAAWNTSLSNLISTYIYNSTVTLNSSTLDSMNTINTQYSSLTLVDTNVSSAASGWGIYLGASRLWAEGCRFTSTAPELFSTTLMYLYNSNITLIDSVLEGGDNGILSSAYSYANLTRVYIGVEWNGINLNYNYGVFTIYNSTINSSVPFVASFSSNISVTQTRMRGDGYASQVRSTLNFTMGDSALESTALIVKGDAPEHFDHRIVNNTVDGKPLAYYFNVSNTVFTGSYGELFIAWSRNVSVRGAQLGPSAIPLGIACSNDTTVEGLNLRGGFMNMYVYYSRNVRINNVSTSSSSNTGIYIEGSSGIVGNITSYDDTYGLAAYLSGATQTMDLGNITCIGARAGCIMASITRGSYLYASGLTAVNTTGNLTGTKLSGVPPGSDIMRANGLQLVPAINIYLYYSDAVLQGLNVTGTHGDGLRISVTRGTLRVEDSVIGHNNNSGVWMWSSSGITFDRVRITDNGVYGVYSYGSWWTFTNGEIGGAPTAVYLYGGGADLRYNSLPSGTLLARYGGTLDARWNWWGTTNGTEIAGRIVEITDPGGRVGTVLYEPWLYGPATGGYATVSGNGVIVVDPVWLEFAGAASAEIGASTYSWSVLTLPAGSVSMYDVYLADPASLTSLDIGIAYDENMLRAMGASERALEVYWWNGSEWVQCSNIEVDAAGDTVWIHVDASTSPSLANLTGTPILLLSPPAVVGGVLPSAGAPQHLGHVLLATLAGLLVLGAALALRRRL